MTVRTTLFPFLFPFTLAVASIIGVPITAVAQMHVEVKPNRVDIGVQYIPRRLDLPPARVKQILAGQTYTPGADETWDYVEGAGTLKFDRTRNTIFRVTTLINLPNGTLDMGTQADPIPCGVKAEIIFRNVPIDPTKDPFRWGNGLVNFGKQTRVGCAKTEKAEAAGSVNAGAITITLAAPPPADWKVGDEILLPDTTTPIFSTPTNSAPRRESKATITSISGTSITLSKGLDFAHPAVTHPFTGAVVMKPRVLNITRNIILRSEDPTGTPGHTVDIGHDATWDIRYNRNEFMGRTTATPLDDSVVDTAGIVTHSGTNDRGRYAEHHHHVQSAPTSADVGNVYIGRGMNPDGTGIGAKWGLALHDTSDTLIERDIALDFPGAGFATEDGYEVRNIFRFNLAFYNLGHLLESDGNTVQEDSHQLKSNCPGCGGNGFWLRGTMNYFEGNEAGNNFLAGMDLFNQQQPPGQYPSAPGLPPDTDLDTTKSGPLSFLNNIFVGNVASGLEMWAIKKTAFVNIIAARNMFRQIEAVNSEHIDVFLQNPTILCDPGKGSIGVASSMGYVSTYEQQGGVIAGCFLGVNGGGGANGMVITGAILQNETNLDMLGQVYEQTNTMHLAFPGQTEHRYIMARRPGDDPPVWDGVSPLPNVGLPVYFPQIGSRIKIRNWQGTGQDKLLFRADSLGNNPSWYAASSRGAHFYNTPVKGLTMRQSWNTYGLSAYGDMLEESQAETLDGVVGGLARAGLTVTLPPPRAICSYPNIMERAPVDGSDLRFYCQLTGDPTQASGIMMISLDKADPPYPWAAEDGINTKREGTTTNIDPTICHTIDVWRTFKDNPQVMIPGTLFTQQYYTGTTNPCGTTPTTTVAVPNVVGQLEAPARAAITGVGLVVGQVTSVTNTAPVGQIVTETPIATTMVNTGSTVNLEKSSGPPPPPPPPAPLFSMPSGTYRICSTTTPPVCFDLIKQ